MAITGPKIAKYGFAATVLAAFAAAVYFATGWFQGLQYSLLLDTALDWLTQHRPSLLRLFAGLLALGIAIRAYPSIRHHFRTKPLRWRSVGGIFGAIIAASYKVAKALIVLLILATIAAWIIHSYIEGMNRLGHRWPLETRERAERRAATNPPRQSMEIHYGHWNGTITVSNPQRFLIEFDVEQSDAWLDVRLDNSRVVRMPPRNHPHHMPLDMRGVRSVDFSAVELHGAVAGETYVPKTSVSYRISRR